MTGSTNNAQLARVFRKESGRVLAALIAQLRDFDLAEDALQDAITEALRVWPTKGTPSNGGAWLLTVARRRALDRLRKSAVRNSDIAQETIKQLAEVVETAETDFTIPDERLRLIFTCCHPALAADAQVALTLRTMCGLTTREIARAFLTSEPTMHQRLTRAKHKIKTAGISYEVPEKTDIPARLQPVLSVIYLIYNESYSAFEGQDLTRADLAQESIRLANILMKLLPDPEVMGLLALITLHNARRGARTGPDGGLIPLEQQNRTLWNHLDIANGKSLLMQAMAQRRPGPYQIQAAVSALHCEAETWEQTDWHQIIGLYGALYALDPSPVVSLNLAVASANSGNLTEALTQIDALEPALKDYQPFFAARGEIRARAGKIQMAIIDFRRAVALSNNVTEQDFLRKKLALWAGTEDD